MKLYEFTFVIPEFDDKIADRIYAQCPDTSIGKSNGILYVAFDREAVSLESALSTAAEDLRQLGISPIRIRDRYSRGSYSVINAYLKMHLTIDRSALISIIGNEESKDKIVGITTGYSLFAPASVHWEIGNAFSAMFKRQKTSIESATRALEIYQGVSIEFIEVPLEKTLKLSHTIKNICL